jgi:hypothetical protein
MEGFSIKSKLKDRIDFETFKEKLKVDFLISPDSYPCIAVYEEAAPESIQDSRTILFLVDYVYPKDF